MLARRFEILSIDLNTIEGLSAVHREGGKTVIRFRADDIGLIRTVRKRNTQLFDCLSVIKGDGYRYAAAEGVLRDFRDDLAMVSYYIPPEMDNIAVYDRQHSDVMLHPAQDIVNILMEDGFFLGTTKYVPLVASAAMSRTNNYLYVKKEHADALMRAITLDMIAMDEDGNPYVSGCGADTAAFTDRRDPFISIPKAAAYAGNAYSDGSSVWEMLIAGNHPRGDALDIDRLLNAQSVVCVRETPVNMHLDRMPAVWASHRLPMERATLRADKGADAEPDADALIQFFRYCCSRENKTANLNSCSCDTVRLQWQQMIDACCDDPTSLASLNVQEGSLLPCLPEGDEAKKVIRPYALVCALALYAHQQGSQRHHVSADKWEPLTIDVHSDPQALRTALTKALDKLTLCHGTPSAWWETISQLLAPPEINRNEEWTLGIQAAAGTPSQPLTVTLRKAPCAYRYEAQLRKANEKDSIAALDDGVGFADDFFFNKLEELMFGTVDEKAPLLNAVQIRLPWVKGLLVRFSFTQWLQEKHEAGKQLYIRDLYGKARPLFETDVSGRVTGVAKIHVMLTDSMFKGQKWFQKVADQQDPWEIYWQRIRAHRISLLIAGKNSQPANGSRLNYQFLSTLRLPEKTLQKLTERQLKELLAAGQDKDKMRALIFDLNLESIKGSEDENNPDVLEEQDNATVPEASDGDTANSEDTEDEDEEIAIAGEDAHAEPMPAADCSYVSDQYEALLHSTVLDMMRGRLRVQGDVRYIVPDLLQMIRQIDHCAVLESPHDQPPKAKYLEIEGAINDAALYSDGYHGRYYAPGKPEQAADTTAYAMRAPWIDAQGAYRDVLCLRNPHLTVGEDPILKPLAAQVRAEYDRWFRQLNGCVMIPNIAMQVINGADCDGDRANLVCEPDILNAARAVTMANNILLGSVAERADELLAYLNPEHYSKGIEKEYIALLRGHISDMKALGGVDSEALKRSLISVPPLYAGSGAKSRLFSPADLACGPAMAREFRQAFRQSTEQRIGKMSLDILNIANSASRRNIPQDGDADSIAAYLEGKDAAFLANEYLAAMLLVNASLDTALEIDLAKTGMKRGTSPLMTKTMDKTVKELMQLEKGGAPFRTYRTMYKKRERFLLRKPKPYQKGELPFDKKLESLMKDWDLLCKAERSGANTMTLNLLPALVYQHYTDGTQAVARNNKQLKSILTLPKTSAPQMEACCDAFAERVQQYKDDVKAHKEAETLVANLHKRYSYVAAWILKGGYTLRETILALEDMRLMLSDASWQQDATVNTLADRLMDDDRQHVNYYAAWAWGSQTQREALLAQLLTIDQTTLACGGQIRQILLSSPNGMQLMKQILRYLQSAALLRKREQADKTGKDGSTSAAEVVITPGALARRLKAIAVMQLPLQPALQAALVQQPQRWLDTMLALAKLQQQGYILDAAALARIELKQQYPGVMIDQAGVHVPEGLAGATEAQLLQALRDHQAIYSGILQALPALHAMYEGALIQLFRQGVLNDFLFVHLMGKEINQYLPENVKVVKKA